MIGVVVIAKIELIVYNQVIFNDHILVLVLQIFLVLRWLVNSKDVKVHVWNILVNNLDYFILLSMFLSNFSDLVNFSLVLLLLSHTLSKHDDSYSGQKSKWDQANDDHVEFVVGLGNLLNSLDSALLLNFSSLIAQLDVNCNFLCFLISLFIFFLLDLLYDSDRLVCGT
jgi:hypothetical protein